MPGAYTRRILEHLGHESYAPSNPAQLAQQLNVPPEDADELRNELAELVEKKLLVLMPSGQIALPPVGDEITGVFRRNIKGFGFVVPDKPVREGDVYIGAENVKDALTGDKVRVQVGRRKRPGGAEELYGQIVEVLARKRACFSGELIKKGNQWAVMPDGREMRDPIIVRDPEAKNAHAGHKVIVEITHYPEGDFLAEGVITKVLGEAGRPDVETLATIEAYNLPKEFPNACLEQARKAGEQYHAYLARVQSDPAAMKDREDRRADYVITIDPPDAKDYDDALSITRLPDGGWKLAVHIADVAHFIPHGSALDEEAKLRGNSVYLPKLVIPMLPEVLSNGICSLQEGVPRFCKSTFHQYDSRGNMTKSGVAQTLIQSTKRLTYLEAQALIDGDFTEARKHAKTDPKYTDQLVDTLKEMDACSKMIRLRRRAAGMIHLELPAVELVFDETGRVVDAHPEDNAYTHTLIEMFMVEANEVLARLFARLHVPLLRRIHPEPTPGDVDDLRSVAKVAGFAIPKNPTRMELQKLLDATKGTPAAPAVHLSVLRTLTRAEYSPAAVGHFALASDAYAHFTSPIRRYPDLTVHRALAEYLKHTANGSKPPATDADRKKLGEKMMDSPNCPNFETLEKIGKACSITEENASAAEQNLRSFLVLQLLEGHVGEQYQAIVTGVSNGGVFVKLDKYLIDGMIKSADLPPGKEGRVGAWRLDQRTGALVNQASGRSFQGGDRLVVTIAKVDLALRQMDLVVSDPSSRDKGKPKAVFDRKGRVPGPGDEESAGGGIGGGIKLDWEQVKYGGKSGSTARSQKSKSRDKGKKHHRRDK